MTTDDVLRAIYRKDTDALGRLTAAEANRRDADGRTPLMHAILAEDADAGIVRLLVDRGAEVNVTDAGQHWTPLHFAARDQREDLVAILLGAGANVDPVDTFGNTPLWRALSTRDALTAVVEALVSHGADPGRKNQYGVAPIDKARDLQRPDLVSLLESSKRP